MPITTFYFDQEQKELQDKELNNVVKNMSLNLRSQFAVLETEITERKWFKTKKKYLYELLYKISGAEYQIINFYVSDSDSSINTKVNADIIVAYLMATSQCENEIEKIKREPSITTPFNVKVKNINKVITDMKKMKLFPSTNLSDYAMKRMSKKYFNETLTQFKKSIVYYADKLEQIMKG